MRTWILLSAAASCLLAQSSEQRANYQSNWPCTGKERTFDPVYLHTAEATGGQLFLFDKSETSGFTTIAIQTPKHPATIARSVGRLENYLDIRVPIDPSIESLYVSTTVQCLQRVILWDPQIIEVLPQQIGGEDHVFRAVRISIIPKPAPGIWTIRVLGTGSYSLVVQAKTNLNFSAKFSNQNITALTSATAPRFRLVTETGDPLQPLDLLPAGPGRYSGTVMAPPQPFRILMENTEEQGQTVQRLDPRLFNSGR
ncbi:MAG TPA: hypothetical protein VGN17_05440 [Bryobacteraceae bacterium]|jgi:hypothetical protein